MAQGVRPSQFVTTFGPGALVETPDGPHILLSTNDALRRIEGRYNMDDLTIRDIRLQKGLLSGSRIFKIPDSDNERKFIYPAKRFPTWNLCIQHQAFNVIHRNDSECPECKTAKAKAESKSAKNAIRFLLACPEGHLDDVPWSFIVHAPRLGAGTPAGQGPRCTSKHFHWIGSGSSLSAIRIRCPICSAEKELGEIYSRPLRCPGRSPEREGRGDDIRDACPSEDAIIVQRGSFQLRLPEVVTALTIPPLVNNIHRVLQRDVIQLLVLTLKASGAFNETNFRNSIAAYVTGKRIPSAEALELEKAAFTDIDEGLREIENASTRKTPAEFLTQEHVSLNNVVTTGFPPYPYDNDRRPGEPISFQVESTDIQDRVFGPKRNLVFRVMPIERLRVVMVQTGFRRVRYIENSVLRDGRGSFESSPQEKWLPGVELFGEGIFIDLNPLVGDQHGWYPKGSSVTEWDARVPAGEGTNHLLNWNALSVWWHSLSHRLINAMSLHSGYSSTAIRERVYLSEIDGKMTGGILLYTTQAGGDGTMGGLTSLVQDFEHIFELAFAGIDRCSNDPLCENAEIDEVSKLGAACYSCEMVSETSCEHLNGYLNRRLLLDNHP